MDKADVVFLPVYLEDGREGKGIWRHYCYYTQYAHTLVANLNGGEHGGRILRPLIRYLYGNLHARFQLYTTLRQVTGQRFGFADISNAYASAMEFVRTGRERLREEYQRQAEDQTNMRAILLGRPYTVLPRSMNKGIPETFASLGVKTFYLDMLPLDQKDDQDITPLLQEVHWLYAARILKAAEFTARSPGDYPVLITSFRCSPDSFIIDYFKCVMESHGKPYLILQLDEHDSNFGYETRIESAIRSFRNHHGGRARAPRRDKPAVLRPERLKKLNGKTLFLPNWDPISFRLIAASFKRVGVKARVIRQTEVGAAKGLRQNTGQCTPLNIIAQDFIENVRQTGLDPSRCALWIPVAKLACNLALFPHHIKTILGREGGAFEQVGIYRGDMTFAGLSMRLPVNMYLSYLFGGLMRKMTCRIRPYEEKRGSADLALELSLRRVETIVGQGGRWTDAAREVVEIIRTVRWTPKSRPKVAIFGDLYVRDNEVANQNLVRFIEDNGGEVIVTPYTDFLKMIAGAYFRKWLREGSYLNVLTSEAWLFTLNRLEERYREIFRPILGEPQPKYDAPVRDILESFNIRPENTGESMENILKIHYLLRDHPDVSLFIQASPAFCCPSQITEAMTGEIERQTGVPVVSLTYDGTADNKNEAIIPYLKFSSGGPMADATPPRLASNASD